jgi:small subunit ribosomal protein S20
MPHSISAKKRVRQIVRKSERNRTIKSRLRSARRAVAKALEANDLPAARDRLKAVEQLLHRAANNGPVHRNTAARTIGRLQKKIATLAKTAAPK